MARERKYAGLPDMDDAPDIYETPELTDDTSTVPTATHAQSDDEFYDVEDDTQIISRSRLRIDEARAHFLPAHVSSEGVDFSERVDGKRKSYKASSRRQRILQDGTRELGDLSDDDDDESLERRIARLRREVEEVKEVYARKKEAPPPGVASESQAEGGLDRLQSLSHVLDEISRPVGTAHTTPAAAPLPAPAPPSGEERDATATATATAAVPVNGEATYTVTYAPTYDKSHALARAAEFDRRLLMLERGLGINESPVPEAGSEGLGRAILPTLDSLEKQISTLAQASTANLDAISRRVRSLAAEQDKLNDAREKAKTLREELGAPSGAGAGGEEPEQEAKVKALYGILPTIESLTPILPPLLDRLRSLRVIHADAAAAGERLDRIDRDQASLAEELKQWRTGLEKMEGSIGDGNGTSKENLKVMEAWVKDLEGRLASLQ
ncbi:nuclear migration protein JNM1 [Geosmithia morbida]|uniref:Nuclear migration protein JNM1 n=1 Tax=Geosmithia morbida TaxID=1094350 RepID=A0A9P4YTD5_9HYPO|nr:nuclear migration protein JNM1 [Geosmithia morbida]KAF4121363.1 nuclear migration protein JNM1 [Geosmithia morbida]